MGTYLLISMIQDTHIVQATSFTVVIYYTAYQIIIVNDMILQHIRRIFAITITHPP